MLALLWILTQDAAVLLNRLKWKSPSENSIDFKLELRFPPKIGTGEVDFQAKPIFKLMACHEPSGGGRREGRYEFFDLMEIPNEEWEQ